MKPITDIRKNIFQMTQAEFAIAAGVTQPTVSRWDSGELFPSTPDMAKIRSFAKSRGLEWSDAWFFDGVPQAEGETV